MHEPECTWVGQQLPTSYHPTDVGWCREVQRFERWATAHSNARVQRQIEHVMFVAALKSLQHDAKLPIVAVHVEPAVYDTAYLHKEAAECRISGRFG